MLLFITRAKSIPVLAAVAIVLAAAAVAAFASNTTSVFAIDPPGATLYEQINFNNDPKHPGGASLTITEDISCLQSDPINFPVRARSLKVVPGTIVILYEKCNFQGKAAVFLQHVSDLGAFHDVKFNEKVASVRIIFDDRSLGNDHKELLARLKAVESQLNARMDAHDLNIDTGLAAHDLNIDTDLDDHDLNIDTDLDAHDTNIDIDLDGHVNPDPFEVTLQTCIALGAEAGLQGGISIAREGLLEASLGIDAYGNGASVEVNQPLRGELGGFLGRQPGYNH